MDSAPLDFVAVAVLIVFALVVVFIGGKGFQLGARLAFGGLSFLLLAAVAAWLLGYGQAEIQQMYLLRHAKDSFGVGSSVVLGYGLLIGAVAKIAWAWLSNGRRNDA